MINLGERMGPDQDRTRDPGSAVRHASVARHVTLCYAARNSSFEHPKQLMDKKNNHKFTLKVFVQQDL